MDGCYDSRSESKVRCEERKIRKEQKREINAIMIDTIIKSETWVKDILLLHFDVAKPVINT